MSNQYKAGDKVEVKVKGEWMEGTYVGDMSQYENMKATPNRVQYKGVNSSGSGYYSDADVRPWTGSIQPPVAPRVEPDQVNIQALETAIAAEINTMRANPSAYADKLAALKNCYKFVEGRSWYLNMPQEGGLYLGDSEAERADHERWLDETIADLKQSPVLSQLQSNQALHGGADFFASDTGNVNGPQHVDSQGRGAQERAKLAGYMGGVNECIAGDQRTAFGTVAQLLIDWKVESRGHRKNLMQPATQRIGVACHYFPQQDLPGGWVNAAYIRTVIQCGY